MRLVGVGWGWLGGTEMGEKLDGIKSKVDYVYLRVHDIRVLGLKTVDYALS